MPALEAGVVAPDFTLTDPDGKSHTLSEALKDGPVLLAFYKDTCPVCQYAFPFIERIQQGLNGAGGVRIWGIAQDDADATRDFARDYGCTFPLLIDQEGYPVSNDYGITNVPTLFLVEPGGKISHSADGFDRKVLETVAEEFGSKVGSSISVIQPGEAVPDHKPG